MPQENILVDLVQSSTIHGINHIYSATNRCFKVLWIFLFLFGIGGITINLYFLLTRFFSNPALLSYTFEYESFQWPHITICNPAAPYYLKEGTPEFRHWDEIRKKTKVTLDVLVNEIKEIKNQNKTDHEFEERTLMMSSINPRAIGLHMYRNYIRSVFYSMKRPLIHYNKDPFMNYQFFPNLDELFSTQIVQITNNFPCQTLHIDQATSIKSKYIRSIQFYITFNYDSYKLFNSSHEDKAVYVYLTYGNEMPRGDELILSPGYNHIYQISQTRFIYNGIKRHCIEKWFAMELYDAMLQSTKLFEGTYDFCKEIVSQKMYVQRCGCYSPYLPIYKNGTYFPKLCFNATHFSNLEVVDNAKCMRQAFKEQKNNSKFFKEFCKEYELSKCDRVTYKFVERKEMYLDIWSQTFSDRRYAYIKQIYEYMFRKPALDKIMFEKLRDTMIGFEIKRERKFGDKYEEEKAYPFSELLSDIGGLMGLWMGMSVVGLFEIVEFLYNIAIRFCYIHKRKEKIPENIEQTEKCL